ncbi:MAG: hypothetical protein JKY10_03170 [Cohaesibacteraceae bacterium]|nr:hypothetical protein [Cohaesibacteraceae bacterium]
MLKFVTGLCVCLVLAGCQTQANRDVGNWYDWQVVKQPSTNRIRICHGFDCHYQEPLIIDDGSIAKLGEIIAEGSGSAAEERQALAKAVQWFEILVGPIVGSDKDIGGFVGDASGERGQMDCIDEATNTTSLFLLAEKKWLYQTPYCETSRRTRIPAGWPVSSCNSGYRSRHNRCAIRH